MTGIFAKTVKPGRCVISNCPTKFPAGELVYLFKKIEQQTVCVSCAKARWGYEPSSVPAPVTTAPSVREPLGFDSTKRILQQLQRRANQGDQKARQLGSEHEEPA